MIKVADFHTHILPCVDDGSDSVDRSLEMLRCEYAQNVSTVALTPHFYPNSERPEVFLERRNRSLGILREAVKNEKDSLPRMLVGAEVGYFEGISDCEYLPDLAISGTDCIMIEMPFVKWTPRMLSELSEIHQKHDLVPIIAHIERYIGGFHPCVSLKDLAALPVLLQVSADFFVRRASVKKALSMFKSGNVHLLGSDAHNMSTRRPNVGTALDVIRRSLGDGAIDYISSVQDDILRVDYTTEI